MWAIYSSLTIYGAFMYPYYSTAEKFFALVKVAFIPFIGAYLVNHDMGFRLSKQSKQDLTYELPFWTSLGIRPPAGSLDDD